MVKEHLGLGFFKSWFCYLSNTKCVFPNFVYGECIYNAKSSRRGFSLGFMEKKPAVTHRKDNCMFPLYDNSLWRIKLRLLWLTVADRLKDVFFALASVTEDDALSSPLLKAGSENQADSIESSQVFRVFVVWPAAISCRAGVAFGSAWLICFAAASYNRSQSIQYVCSYRALYGKLEGSPTAISLKT